MIVQCHPIAGRQKHDMVLPERRTIRWDGTPPRWQRTVRSNHNRERTVVKAKAPPGHQEDALVQILNHLKGD